MNNRAGYRSHRIFLAISILIAVLLLPGCIHAQDRLRVSIADGEYIVLKKSFVKYVNIESDDRGYSRSAVIYLAKEGDEALYKVLERNVGKYASLYYGDRLIKKDTIIREAYRLGRIGFLLESEKDEALAAEIIKAYPADSGKVQ
jgi:hypothetical protein